MKAIVMEEPGKLVFRDVPDVSPGTGEVKLKIRATGICGSDIPGFLGISGRRIPPMIMGHEFSGEVVELGEGCGELKIGDRVSAFPHYWCGKCENCLSGYDHMCVHKRSYGVLDTDGAFAEYLCVPENSCFKLGDDISYEIGSMMEPLAVSYRAVNKGGDLKGKTVFLVGTGTIGLMALACIASQEPALVMVSDVSDTRLEFAKKVCPGVVTVNAARENVEEVVMAHTDGKGAQVCFEAVGAGPTTKQTIDAAGHTATVVWVGMNKPIIETSMMSIVTKELCIKGSFLYSRKEFGEAVAMINSGRIRIDALISRVAPLEEGVEIMYDMAKDASGVIKVILAQN